MPHESYITRQGEPRNVIFESPHQGRDIPPALGHHKRLVNAAARRWDNYIDTAGEFLLDAVGGSLIHSRVSRLTADLNRGADRVDARVCPTWPGAKIHRDGGVIVPFVRLGKELVPLYDSPLGEDEVEYRLREFWYPYHERLQASIGNAVKTFGSAILIGLHSVIPKSVHVRGNRPVVYLGTRNGRTCNAKTLDILCTALENQGITVIAEDYYQGAFTTQSYGQEKDVDAIQIELDRRFLRPETTAGKNSLLHSVVSALQMISIGGEHTSGEQVNKPVKRSKRHHPSQQTYIDTLTGDVQPY